MPLSEKTKAIVKNTAPVLAEHGETIASYFYQDMFRHNPELLEIFNGSNQHTGAQPRALAAAVYGYAANIDNLAALTPVVQRIAHKHASFNIKPEHYPIVGKHLLGAIVHVLGDQATDDIIQAWTEAYEFLASIFMEVEEGIYHANETQEGGWRGTRAFRVAKKIQESSLITSFYFESVDQKPIATFMPGQYIGLYLHPSNHPYQEIRQYSLSDAPNNKYYRISVKREPQGVASNYLHDDVKENDIIHLSAPAGDFYLNQNSKNPVVLISAGVGLTPMMSMLNTLIQKQSTRKITFVHAAVDGNVHAFKQHIQQITKAHDNVSSVVFYSNPKPNDSEYDYTGYVNLTTVRSQITDDHTDYYLCGPIGFMSFINEGLKNLGITPEHTHFEVFGPHKILK
ncbi:Flavohemoprotein [invertebrate metagenome]|uniref:Flavohemoprotein n=1 Tax=invertebrate metagenome TaxID=1711999 RepID=A0A2H9TAN0_9ZZZZ